MAATTITRVTWTDGASGTVINNAVLHSDIYAKIDQMFAGAGGYATFTFGGLVAAEGFGTHLFSAGGTGAQAIKVRNTSAGTGNYASLELGNDASATLGGVSAFSSTFTTSTYSKASGVRVLSSGSGGLTLVASAASSEVVVYGNNAQLLTIGGGNSAVSVNESGVSPDTSTYGVFGVTRAATAGNLSYISLTRSGSSIWSVGINSSNEMIIGSGNTSKLLDPFVRVASTGVHPNADDTYNLGSSSFRWANVYATTVNTGDLMLENGWALTESYKVGAHIDGVALVDRLGNVQCFVDGAGRLYAREVRPLSELAWFPTTPEQRAAITRPSWAQ